MVLHQSGVKVNSNRVSPSPPWTSWKENHESLVSVAALTLAISSIQPANAGKRTDGCNETSSFAAASDPCPPGSQGDQLRRMVEIYRKLGWRGSERESCDAAEKRPAIARFVDFGRCGASCFKGKT